MLLVVDIVFCCKCLCVCMCVYICCGKCREERADAEGINVYRCARVVLIKPLGVGWRDPAARRFLLTYSHLGKLGSGSELLFSISQLALILLFLRLRAQLSFSSFSPFTFRLVWLSDPAWLFAKLISPLNFYPGVGFDQR